MSKSFVKCSSIRFDEIERLSSLTCLCIDSNDLLMEFYRRRYSNPYSILYIFVRTRKVVRGRVKGCLFTLYTDDVSPLISDDFNIRRFEDQEDRFGIEWINIETGRSNYLNKFERSRDGIYQVIADIVGACEVHRSQYRYSNDEIEELGRRGVDTRSLLTEFDSDDGGDLR